MNIPSNCWQLHCVGIHPREFFSQRKTMQSVLVDYAAYIYQINFRDGTGGDVIADNKGDASRLIYWLWNCGEVIIN